MSNVEEPTVPLISIVTVALNSANLLKETMQSVQQQHFNDFEYVVIDGASSDNTPSVLKEFEEIIDIVVCEADDGVYHAMNKALSMVSGRYVYFLNAGDVLLHEKVLSLVANELNSIAPSIFVGSGIRCSKETGKLIFLEYQNEIFDLEFFRRKTINHQCVFAQRQLFERRPFDLRYKMLADYDWLIQSLVVEKVSIQYSNVGVVRYLNEGLSNQNYELFCEEKKQILAQFSEPDDPQLRTEGMAVVRVTQMQKIISKLKRMINRLKSYVARNLLN